MPHSDVTDAAAVVVVAVVLLVIAGDPHPTERDVLVDDAVQ